jgi:L-ascorbate metabolism protein UlaG (beta-lactamase superfamily)
MRASIFSLLLLLVLTACGDTSTSTAATTEAPSETPVMENKKEVVMTPIFHAAVVLEYDGLTIFVDPYDKPEKFASFGAPDMVVITHTHGDHFNQDVLSSLDLSGAELFGPAAVTEKAGEMGFKKVTALANGEDAARGDITVNTVAAYNLPKADDSFHPPGKFNGYVIDMGGQRYYFSGDTEDVEEMRALEDIDVAFVCMNLPYTMEMAAAADAVLDFKPEKVYPYHYRNKDGTFMDTKEFARLVEEGDKTIEVAVVDWYK